MLRRSLTRVLQQLLQRKQPPAQDTVQQYAVQVHQVPQHHQCHAAAISAHQRHAAAAAAIGASVNALQDQGQQQQQLKQMLQQHEQAKQLPLQQVQQAKHHLQQQLVPEQQPEHTQTASAITGADSISSSSGSLSSTSPESGSGGDDALAISSFEEQYQQTLAHLHVGHTRNLSHLAQLFDPRAVLAAPDKGAAILEALMFGAAKMGDAALMSQLLRCMDAAQIPISSTGHTAVMHGLARMGRTAKAVKWLKESVPQQLLTSSMIRNVVQPLLQQGHVAGAEDVVRWASSRAQPLQLQDTTTAAEKGQHEHPIVHDAGDQQVPLLRDDYQQLLCMRLMVAAAKGNLGVVQAEWAAVQQEQQQLLEVQQQNGLQMWRMYHPHLLGVPVWCSYVSALGQIGKKNPTAVHKLMQGAIGQLADVYHTTAWAIWAHRAAAWQQRQQQGSAQQQQTASWSSPQQQDWPIALQRQQIVALQAWQEVMQQLPRLTWQDLDPSVVLPFQVAVGVRQHERDLLRRAFDAALHMAATQLDAAWMNQLLKLASMLRIFPKSWGFDALLNLQVWQGAPPETIEALLSEIMGWGVAPTLSHYEHLMEAYALHRHLSAAIHVLDRMQAAGHTPLLRTYNRLLHGISLNGDIAAASGVFLRLKAQGLLPDQQTMRALFKCVRLYAVGVRVDTARKLAQAKPGDRESIKTLLSQRSGLFTAAYSQLATWQGEMVAAGLKHNSKSMHQLLSALERLGAVNDCLHLADLHEEMKPGTYTAHRFALQAASRKRDAHGAGTSAKLALKLASGQEGLQRRDYTALIAANFWLQHDHEQLIKTVQDMIKAGYDLDESVLLQLLHVYCTSGMWGEALQVLDDLAAGRIRLGVAEASSIQQHGGRSRLEHWLLAKQQKTQGAAVAATSSSAQQWKIRQYGDSSDQNDATSQQQMAQDKLWHVVMRKLWEDRASDSLLNEFLSRMNSEQLQRFKVLYNLRPLPDTDGYTMQPLQDWQLQAPEQGQQGQEHVETVETDAQRPLHLV